jgi:hypothetical protein
MQVLLQLTNIPPGSSVGPSFSVVTDPLSTPIPAIVSLAQLTSPGGVLVTIPDDTLSISIQSLGTCTNEVGVDCIDPFTYSLEKYFESTNTPTPEGFTDYLRFSPILIPDCPYVCKIGCDRYILSSVETYLKYAEGVDITTPVYLT